ncbi:MAG: hypothetical protein KatS3mg110_3766 [Pirellulaceae bacterium]|nr:MAG: hypothetical protein KatS3mg110_3766 [Pirellulaceae bacterium]
MRSYRRIDLILAIACVLLSLAAIWPNSVCVTLNAGDPARSAACTAPAGCVNQTSECIEGPATESFFQGELSYQACLSRPVTSKVRRITRDRRVRRPRLLHPP